MIKPILLLPCCLLLFTWAAIAQNNGSVHRQNNSSKEEGQVVLQAGGLFQYKQESHNEYGAFHRLILNRADLEKIVNSHPEILLLRLPKGGDKFLDLELKQAAQKIDGASFYLKNHTGKKDFAYQPGLHYRGAIQGKGGASLAAISIFEDGAIGVIADESETWNLGPVENDFRQGEYYLFSNQVLRLPINFKCGVADDPPGGWKSLQEQAGQGATMQGSPCVGIYFECDYDLFRYHDSDVWRTMNYATALFNVAAAIFENEQVNVRLAGLAVWDEPDGYLEDSSLVALNSFINRLGSDFEGDVAMLLANDNNGNGGLAITIGFQCNSANNRHSYSDINGYFSQFPAYSWDVGVTAHELGHLFGSHHTHWCGWVGGPIDNCGPIHGYPTEGGCADGPTPVLGTIMSYCHINNWPGISLTTANGGGFGPQPTDAMLNYLNALGISGCLAPCECPGSLVAADIPASILAETPPFLHHYKAANDIESSSTIQMGAYARYTAGQEITLRPGFWSKRGSVFNASIEECQDPVSAREGLSQAYLPELTAMDKPPGFSFKIVPNPSNKQAFVEFQLDRPKPIAVSVYAASGALIRGSQFEAFLDAGHHRIELPGSLPSGLYIVFIHTGDQWKESRWVVF